LEAATVRDELHAARGERSDELRRRPSSNDSRSVWTNPAPASGLLDSAAASGDSLDPTNRSALSAQCLFAESESVFCGYCGAPWGIPGWTS
jgi:hypothetical protein